MLAAAALVGARLASAAAAATEMFEYTGAGQTWTAPAGDTQAGFALPAPRSWLPLFFPKIALRLD